MQLKLIINGQDFSPWLVEDGLTFGETYRQSRDIITLDGTLYRSQFRKLTMDVGLVELRDNTLALLTAALYSAVPASVQYTTGDGVLHTNTFYVSDLSYGAKTVRGGNTYYSGAGFSLEAR